MISRLKQGHSYGIQSPATRARLKGSSGSLKGSCWDDIRQVLGVVVMKILERGQGETT